MSAWREWGRRQTENLNLVPANYACALITFLDAVRHILGCEKNNNYAHLSKVSGSSYNVHFIVRVLLMRKRVRDH